MAASSIIHGVGFEGVGWRAAVASFKAKRQGLARRTTGVFAMVIIWLGKAYAPYMCEKSPN